MTTETKTQNVTDDVTQCKITEVIGKDYQCLYASVKTGDYGEYVRFLIADENDTVFGVNVGSSVITKAVQKLQNRGVNLVGATIRFETRESKNGRPYYSLKYTLP